MYSVLFHHCCFQVHEKKRGKGTRRVSFQKEIKAQSQLSCMIMADGRRDVSMQGKGLQNTSRRQIIRLSRERIRFLKSRPGIKLLTHASLLVGGGEWRTCSDGEIYSRGCEQPAGENICGAHSSEEGGRSLSALLLRVQGATSCEPERLQQRGEASWRHPALRRSLPSPRRALVVTLWGHKESARRLLVMLVDQRDVWLGAGVRSGAA